MTHDGRGPQGAGCNPRRCIADRGSAKASRHRRRVSSRVARADAPLAPFGGGEGRLDTLILTIFGQGLVDVEIRALAGLFARAALVLPVGAPGYVI